LKLQEDAGVDQRSVFVLLGIDELPLDNRMMAPVPFSP
jgi:hypothetical protein